LEYLETNPVNSTLYFDDSKTKITSQDSATLSEHKIHDVLKVQQFSSHLTVASKTNEHPPSK
jgi:hypothetical protein